MLMHVVLIYIIPTASSAAVIVVRETHSKITEIKKLLLKMCTFELNSLKNKSLSLNSKKPQRENADFFFVIKTLNC